jgi:RHS repeat-associated protein
VEGSFTSLPFDDGQSTSGTDGDAYHYATLDHDAESNTEHAQFRQYSNAQGRWLSPDPYDGSYDFSNPQSLNRYTYALNAPLSAVDRKGLDLTDMDDTAGGLGFIDPSDDSGVLPDGDPLQQDGNPLIIGAETVTVNGIVGTINVTSTGILVFIPTLSTQSLTLTARNITGCKTGFGAAIILGGDAGVGVLAAGAGANGSVGAAAFGGSNGVNTGVFASGGAGANFGNHSATAGTHLISPNFLGLGAGAGVGIMLTNASQASQLSGPSATWNVDLGWLANGSAQLSQGTDDSGNTIYTFSFSVGYGAGALYHNVTNQTKAKGKGKPGC